MRPASKRFRSAWQVALLACVVAIPGMDAIAQNAPLTPRQYLQSMDTDGDGRVSRAEYIAYMDRGFDRLDTDHNGVLEGDELPPGARPVTRAQYEASLSAAFDRQDTNHDGYLDAHELASPPRSR
jgi:Ca2+-binding EF-hand superfamily protein